MSEVLTILLVFGIFIGLQYYILPRLGVPT